MSPFWLIFNAAFPVYLAGMVGIGARLAGILTGEADKSLMSLTVNLLIPCLILKALVNNPVASDPHNLLLAPLVGFGCLISGYLLSWLAAGWMKLSDQQQRTFSFVVGNYNYGYIALPLVMALFDANTVGVLFVHNLGVDIGMWTVGMMILRGGIRNARWRQLFSAPVVAVFIGIALNLTHLSTFIPLVVLKSLEFSGNCAVPLALILTGAIGCDFRNELNFKDQIQTTLVGSILRMVLIPAIFLFIAWWLPDPGAVDLKKVLVVQAAMPAAMLPIILTKLYGGDVRLALRQVVATSLISFVSIPLVIHFGLRFLKLN